MRTCSICGKEKPLEEFYVRKARGNGKATVSSACKECSYEKIKAHRKAFPEKVRVSLDKHRRKHREKYNRLERERHARSGFITKDAYNEKNRERNNARQRDYNKREAATIRVKQCISQRKRRAADPAYRISESLGTQLNFILRNIGGSKCDSMVKLIKCNRAFLRVHFESQWTAGMSWATYGRGTDNKWHGDHIIPRSRFDFRIEEDQRVCFNWRNLQPLWGAINRAKSDKPCIPSLTKLIALLEADRVEEDAAIVARLLAMAKEMLATDYTNRV